MALPLKGGQTRNAVVGELFIQVVNDEHKGAKVTCKYYQKELDKNASRLQDHLNIFKNYQEAARLGQTHTALPAPTAWSQQQITTVVPTCPQKKAEHWTRAAKSSIYDKSTIQSL